MQANLTENEIALKLGVKRQAVNKEMLGRKTSERIRKALCDLTATPAEDMFPEYAGNGKPSKAA
jgi:hypothetical protein